MNSVAELVRDTDYFYCVACGFDRFNYIDYLRRNPANFTVRGQFFRDGTYQNFDALPDFVSSLYPEILNGRRPEINGHLDKFPAGISFLAADLIVNGDVLRFSVLRDLFLIPNRATLSGMTWDSARSEFVYTNAELARLRTGVSYELQLNNGCMQPPLGGFCFFLQ